VYAVPFVSPETVIGLADPVPVNAPGLQVARYVVMADPPVNPGAVKLTEADPFPAVAAPMPGAAGGVAYVNALAFVSVPLLAGVKLTGPTAAGVMLNVCAADELLNVSTIGVDNPPPEGVIVMVPLYSALGVTMKLDDAAFSAPPEGPVKV